MNDRAANMNDTAGHLEPFGVDIDLLTGAMKDPDSYKCTVASTMIPYYADRDAVERLVESQNDPVHYEVFEKDVPEAEGHIRICISKLLPGKVGQEFFMTKGHYHTVLETAETYLCIAGEGFLLMKTTDGRCLWEPFRPGRLVYCPSSWAHRSINTGPVPLVSLCHYPANAGHNYGDIVKEGFPKRCFDRSGTPVFQ